ncbi:hypothetical protein [Agarilytica rhodophyticola]|uniref:hypothetical protein n=1 Tax=Agarilytica rhodophyticola TaxID=1737490 RepID=UPI000B3418BF|nr:hypothetical protein [Agarilytica rhodophyticola]
MSVIRCNNINYRKGYIEIEPEIHKGYVNLEVTQIHPDVDIADTRLGDGKLSDEAFIGNTEIELNLEEAKNLIELLKNAIDKTEVGSPN